MKFPTVSFLAILVFLTSCAVSPSVPTQKTTEAIMTESPQSAGAEIRIVPTDEMQRMEGFGASGAWWAQEIGGWESTNRDEIIRLLFDQQTGIGLSIYRYNIGGGDGWNIQDPWRRAETFEVSEGNYDWSRDANAVKVLQAVQAAGVENFVAFANSPPARMTISGLTTGGKDGESNLSPDRYDQFAQYLVEVIRHLRDDLGVPVGWISPVNEPQWSWSYKNGQEGCHYTPAEVVGITQAVVHAIQQNNLAVKVSVFESGEWKNLEAYVTSLLDNNEVRPFLDHISIHSYWSTPVDKAALRQFIDTRYPGTSIWMSEWTEMKEGRDTSMDSALVLANTLQDDLTIGNVTSWQYWIAVSKYLYRDGLIYVDILDHKVTQTKRLWALGNFSRFVRPGFVRVSASSSDDNLRVTVFRSPGEEEWVVVAINNSSQPIPAHLSMDSGVLPGQPAIYETSQNQDLQMVASIINGDGYVFSPKSVTTLVFKP